MIWWRFDPADYKVGDRLFTASGGYAHTVREYTVTRVTQGGHIVAKIHDHEIRVTPNGKIVGTGRWSGEHVISAETAAEMTDRLERERAWRAIAKMAEELASLAYRDHQDAAFDKFNELAQAIEARRAATAKTGAVEDESAVGNADAPKE